MHGRFTSPDEFKGGPDELFDFEEDAYDNPTFYADLTNPQSLNKYQYGYNNPYKYNDPDGHCPVPIIVAGVMIACAVLTGPDYAVAPTGRETPEQNRSFRNTFGGNALLNLGPIKGGGLVGGVLLRNAPAVTTTVVRTTTSAARTVATEVRARSLVRTVKRAAAKGGNQPGRNAKPIRGTEKTIERAGKIWTNNGRPMKGRGGQKSDGLVNDKTGKSYRRPSKKKYNTRKVANFETIKPQKANVHVEVKK